METRECSMVEQNVNGSYLRISCGGDTVPLHHGGRMSFEWLAGAKEIEIQCEGPYVRLSARVPESSGPLLCTIGLDEKNGGMVDSLGFTNAKSVEDWIYRSRVRANGRL